ncbi:DPH4 [Vanrija pseudolonga]|uniref:Diphthamide biosynthesis protein 4 n=1 Tax=Vanrija pseudolonga TaxID=143232 RepID=A0AAF1BGF5_9TREE|nr:DPH4 [Vanrija pseudolonga]
MAQTQPDYYAVLGVARDAPDSEITQAWRRLVLVSHPDKQQAAGKSASPEPSNDIVLINEARAVLSDPAKRAAFDAQYEAPRPPPAAGPRIREHVSLEVFTPHPVDEPEKYTHPCRCGHEYVVTIDDLEAGVDVLGCPGCGEYIVVEYEEVEE